MMPKLTSHAHYYTAAGRGCRHLVTAYEKSRSGRGVKVVCGREMPKSRVLGGDGHRHVTEWADELGDLLCDDCTRRATEPLDAWAEGPDPDLERKERNLRGQT